MQVALNIPEHSLRWWNSCAVTWASSHPSAPSSASPELGWEAGDVSCLLATDPSGGSWPSHTSRPACLTPGRSLLPASAPSALTSGHAPVAQMLQPSQAPVPSKACSFLPHGLCRCCSFCLDWHLSTFGLSPCFQTSKLLRTPKSF